MKLTPKPSLIRHNVAQYHLEQLLSMEPSVIQNSKQTSKIGTRKIAQKLDPEPRSIPGTS